MIKTNGFEAEAAEKEHEQSLDQKSCPLHSLTSINFTSKSHLVFT